MGGGVSKPLQRLTRGQLLSMTQKPRDFINRLFQVMIKDITKEDYLALANPKQCTNFVFVMADALKETFHSLKIVPAKDDKTGMLYFIKRDDLVTKRPELAYYHCLSIAYFYIRIFQIFGALAITVVDSASAGDTTRYLQQQQQGLPTTKRDAGLGAPGQSAVAFGGAAGKQVSAKKMNLDFLKPYVEGGKVNLERIVFGFKENKSFKLLTQGGKAYIVYQYDTAKEPFVSQIKSVKLDTVIADIEAYAVEMQFAFLKKSVKFQVLKSNSDYIVKAGFSLNSSTNTVDEWIINLMKRVLQERLKKTEAGISLGQEEDVFGKREKLPFLETRGSRAAATRAEEYGTTVGAIDSLNTGFMRKAIGDSAKVIPFCVARALQLINVDVIDELAPADVTSRICNTTFAQGRGTIPSADKTLLEAPGLHAMDQLWYTKAYTTQAQDGKYVTKVEVPDSDTVAYKEFLVQMHRLFGDSSKDASRITKLRDVVMAKPKCGTEKMGKDLRLRQDPRRVNPTDVIPHMQQTVETLFRIQDDHTKKVEAFMRTMLFKIEVGKDGRSTVKLQDALINGGIPYLNTISKSARELLISYYSRCEETYKFRIDEVISRGTVA